jgi:hypothetical protein
VYFDLDGNYLYSKQLPFTSIDRYTCDFNDSLYITCRDGINGDSEVVFLDKSTLEVKHPVEPVTPYLMNFTPKLPISHNKDVFYYYCCNDIIYDISSDIGKKTAVYDVDFSEKEKEFKINHNDPINNDKVLAAARQALINGEVRPVMGFLHSEKHIAVNYIEFDKEEHQKQTGGGIGSLQTAFYDIFTKKSYNTKYINFDILNSVKIKQLTILGSDNGYFYAVINGFLEEDELQKMAKMTLTR